MHFVQLSLYFFSWGEDKLKKSNYFTKNNMLNSNKGIYFFRDIKINPRHILDLVILTIAIKIFSVVSFI